MAEISQIKLPDNSIYDLKVFSNHIAPQMSKTYESTSYYATSANQNNSTWYCLSIRPDSYNTIWRISFKLRSYCPNYLNQNSITFSTISGRQNGFTYMNFNDSDSTGHYYISCYPLTSAGYDAGYGHAIGASIFYATNYTNSAHYRTFQWEIYDIENCTVTFLDTPVKWTDWIGTGTINYGNLSNLNASSRGLQETGDANDPSYNNRLYYSSIFKTFAPLYRYQILFTKDDNLLLPANSVNNTTETSKTMTTESFDPFGPIYYYNNTTNYTTAGATITSNATLFRQHHSIDLRYSFNTGSTLTAWKYVYVVAAPQSDGSAKLYSTPIAQDLPNTEDGLIYIRLGWAINTTNIEFNSQHPIFQYKAGKIREYTNNIKINTFQGTANVGKVLTVNSEGSVIPTALEKSDWSENDPTSNAYIENRTHYVEDPVVTEVLTYSSENNNTYYSIQLTDTDSEWINSLEEGTAYTIVLNGTTYTGNFVLYDSYGTQAYIAGNGYLISQELGFENTEEPFAFYIAPNLGAMLIMQEAPSSGVNLSLSLSTTAIHKLDSKFLDGSLILSGEGNNSEIFNGNKTTVTYQITVSGDANATTYTIDSGGNEQTISKLRLFSSYVSIDGYENIQINTINGSTLELTSTLDENNNISNKELFLILPSKIASGSYSHAEGKVACASGEGSHAEGVDTIALNPASHSEGRSTIAQAYNSHAEGWFSKASGDSSHAEGRQTKASGEDSHAEGYYTTASGKYSHAEGYSTTASALEAAHAEGYSTIASGNYSHAEGSRTTASGESSHAEGNRTTASGINAHAEGENSQSTAYASHAEGCSTASEKYSHAEGTTTTASGDSSHAEGYFTTASGKYSHAEGFHTIARRQSQHVFGEYNIADTNGTQTTKGNYIEIVGNGTSQSVRSNARTLDWSGNGWYAGKLTVGTGPTASMDVATKRYVDAATAGITTNLSGLTDTTISSPTNGQILVYDSTTSKWINSTASFVTSSEVNTIVQTAVASAEAASASATAAQEARAGAESAAQTAQAGADAVGLLREQIYNSYPNVEAETGPIVSISDGADGIPVKSLVVGIEPVQEGSGDPSPDNVRPITGWTGCEVVRAGKNLLPYPYRSSGSTTAGGITWTINEDGTVTANGTAESSRYCWLYGSNATPVPSWIKALAGKTVTVSAGNGSFVQGGYASMQMIFYGTPALLIQEKTATIPSDLSPYTGFACVLFVATGNTVNTTVKPQIEIGSAPTTYEPYQGSTYQITFPSSAGTVYGGSLDVTNGVLTVDRAQIASYAGETLPGEWISNRDIYAEGATPTTGAQVVYELATPITYQLTPTEVITTLLGSNAFWADTGDVQEMAYRADTKLYIDGVYEDYQDDLADYADALAALG